MADEIQDNGNQADRDVTISYPASNDYKTLYANGAYGGITPDGTEFKLDLYQEYLQPIDSEIRQVHGVKMGDVVGRRPATLGIIRERVVGVVMTLDKAEILASWMLNKIEKFKEERERIMKAIGDEGNEEAIQSEKFGPESTE